MYRHENGLTWQTSTFTNSGACVEVARPAGEVLVRDSKRRTGPRISMEPAAFADLVEWAKSHQV